MLHKPTIDPEICPAPETLAQHLTDIGSASACTQWTHNRQQKPLSSVEWFMARVGDGGTALNRRCAGSSVCWALCCRELAADAGSLSYQANTGYSHNAVSMLAHHLRCWPNIETTLGE